MSAPIDRRKFLKTAGATAAAASAVLGTAANAHAAPARPDGPIIYVLHNLGVSNFTAVGNGATIRFANLSVAAVYSTGPAGLMMANLPVVASLKYVIVHTNGGPDPITVEIWQQDMSLNAPFGQYVGNAPIASATGAAHASFVSASVPASGAASSWDSEFQLRISGTTANTTIGYAQFATGAS